MAGIIKRLLERRGGATMDAPASSAQFGVEIPDGLRAALNREEIAPRIGRDEALQVPAVLRARNLIAGTLATLPVKHIGPGRVEEDWPLFDQPNPHMARSVMYALTFEDLLFEGIAWWQVTDRFSSGFPRSAEWVDHKRVHVPPAAGPGIPRELTPDFPFPLEPGVIYVDGQSVDERDMIQFLSPNPPLLVHAARAIRTALRLDRTAGMYADEPVPLGYLAAREGADPLDDDEIQKLLDGWAAARRKRAWGYAGGLEPKALQFNAEQIQLADQRQHAVLEIARAAGVDPEDLGVSTTSRTYQNAEHRRQDLLDFTLGAYVSALTDRLSMRDILPRGHVARMKFDTFLRSTTQIRMQSYKTGLEVGAYTPEEIRELEDRPPLTSEQRARIMPQRSGGGEPPAERTPAMSTREGITVPDDLSGLRFSSEDEPLRLTFNDDETAASFKVDVESRTITGMAVPWGKVARSGFRKWKFAQGSLHWTDPSRVKLDLNHNYDQLIDRATRLQDGSRGLTATYKVARGPEGDKALMLAEDGVLDGLSIDIYFNEAAGDSWQPDPSDETVSLVRQATLRGTALTGRPAFDDARVQSVKATQNQPGTGKGGIMPPEDNNPTPAGGVQLDAGEFTTFMGGLADKLAESHKNLTEQLGQSIGESVSAGFKAALEDIHDPQANGPEPVRAARYTVTREEPVYTFDGRGASLVRDAWYAQREHDADASERIRKFHLQSGEVQKLVASHVAFSAGQKAQFTTVNTTAASAVIPPGYRPDLFVPQLAQGRPLYNLLSTGTIANATPFVVPTFGAATGMTGDHTEGNTPTEGTLTLGTKTVTPGAISGKLPLTREIVDSSNPAIDQIALAAMREDYSKQTEQKVYAALNGAAAVGNTASVSAATLGDGSSDTDLTISPARDLLSRYPFVRFAAPNGAAIGQKVTRNFANAKDSTGRPLLPSVGAENSAGMGNAVNQGWSVDGLAFRPAWSITENTGDDIALIMNSADAWAWESPTLAFRFEEKQGPEVIELALFGYFAVHVLRAAGVFAIRLAA